jgi:thiamine biosynthesis lipoprotein
MRIIGVLFFTFLLFLATHVEGQAYDRYEFSEPKMGTKFRIVLYSIDSIVARRSAEQAFLVADSMNSIFSNYESDSEINRLTMLAINGNSMQVSEPLWEVLTYSRFLWKITQGMFDVTIGPISKLWRRAIKRQEFPDTKMMKDAMMCVGNNLIKLHPNDSSVSCKKEKMRLDFGGIAKGYTADQMARVFLSRGIESYLIDVGGDICLGKPPPGENGWKIKLPKGQVKTLCNTSVATSGDRFQLLEWKGVKYSHIINPKTGYGQTDPITISVIAKTCMEADALASAISVMGVRRGSKIAEKQNIQVYFYTNKY